MIQKIDSNNVLIIQKPMKRITFTEKPQKRQMSQNPNQERKLLNISQDRQANYDSKKSGDDKEDEVSSKESTNS